MTIRTPISIVAVACITLAACEPAYLDGADGGPPADNSRTKTGALIGGAIGGIFGLTREDNKVVKGAAGAAIGAAIGGAIGQALDRQAAELRQEIGNDDVLIENTGSELVVTLPQDILFDVDSDFVSFSLREDLRAVARNLQNNPNSTIDVIGHTDNTGSADYNQDLSSRRAGSVASVLVDAGVAPGRVNSFGRGEDQPVASNLTEDGKARNRRVEIIIRPTT